MINSFDIRFFKLLISVTFILAYIIICYQHFKYNQCIIIFSSKVPAFLNVVDIAGLVKGAAEGQGLGNAFLSHISACDAIFHLARELVYI